MGFLSDVHESRAAYSLKDPELAKIFGSGRSTSSGIVVSDELAMMCSIVFACVNGLSSDVAKAPLNLLKRRQNGGADHYIDSKVYHLLKTEPNPEMGAMTFRQTLTAHALTLGGGYAEIEKNALGAPVALWPITPDRIHAKRDERTGRLFYLVDGKTEMRPENVLHIHGLGYDGNSGYALIDMARQVIGLALAAEKFASSFFGNNASFGGIISFSDIKDTEELNAYRTAIEAAHSGSDKAFRLLLLDNAAKFQQYQSTNSDSQLNELRSKQEAEGSRYFRYPLHKLNNLEHATFSNIEHQDLEYYKGAILDWFTLWEQECGRKLIAKTERRLQFFKHNANVFLRGDIASRFGALGIARDKGIINADEWRDLEDMNPQEGGQGKDYLVQSAQIPSDMLRPLAEANIKKVEQDAKPAPAPVVAPSPSEGDVNDANERASRAEAVATELRRQLDSEIEQRAAAEGARDVLATALDARATAAEAAQKVMADLQAELATSNATAAERTVRLTEAKAVLDAAQRDLADATAKHATAASEANDLRTRETALAEKWHNVSVLEASLRAEHEALKVAHATAGESLSTEAVKRLEAEALARELADKLELAEARAAMAETEKATVAEEARQHRAVAEAAQALTVDARGSVIAAHRSLVVHAMRGAIERETDRARRAQQTPEKLRAWIESWYDGHAELMYAALLPAVRVHLAWLGDDADAGELTRGLVAEHIATSRRQLAAVADLEGSELAAGLAGLLRRWETERVNDVPDKLMAREVESRRA